MSNTHLIGGVRIVWYWVLDSDSDFFGVFGQIPSKSIFYTIFGGREGFRWIGIAIGSILGLGFFRMDGQSVPNRVNIFLKLNLHQFPDVCEVISSKSKT